VNLKAYLERIHYTDKPGVDLQTLRSIHRQHLLHIPYENLDVQLGTPLDFDRARIFDKIVTSRRGGWCYEMNGLLEWALEEIGFDVTRMCGGVMRETRGDDQIGNHLVLRVQLDRTYLADVGFGDGIIEPIPLEEGSYQQRFLSFRLERLEDGLWRFHNHGDSHVPSFDFDPAPADESLLAEKCAWLQKDPGSPFMMALIAQMHTPKGIMLQLGKISTDFSASGKQISVRESQAELSAHLKSVFGLHVDISPIWEKVESAHENLFS
jgi:N-hydroxyarylamine O-acetyltransferase